MVEARSVSAEAGLLAPSSGSTGVGDVGELYRTLSRRLEQLVTLNVRAPDSVIEDACQFAWTRLVHHRDRVRRETALPWLVTTAVHEAFKLVRRGGRELSLDTALEHGGESAVRVRAPGPDELFEYRERLAEVRRLPQRQQRLLWLHAAGLTYAEMAVHEDCSERTVERQLLRAKQGIRRRG
jgi:RNA polymerase sigma factor (sigma-70 family)